MASRNWWETPCGDGSLPKACVSAHIRSACGKVVRGNVPCPVCDDDPRDPSLAISEGTKGRRVVWFCHRNRCDRYAIRQALERLGVDPICLGGWCDPEQPERSTEPSGARMDPATLTAAQRWWAVEKLPASLGSDGVLMRMSIKSLSEKGTPSCDPADLLPINQDDFIELAARTGIERGYRYRVFKRWAQRAP